MKKVLYFIAGAAPTVSEAAAIAKLNTLAEPVYTVEVMSSLARAKISAGTLSAAASDNSFNDSGSGFVTAGFKVGMHVGVRGFTGNTANNINDGVITALTASKMTIGGTDGDVIVDDAAGETVVIESLEDTASYGYGIVAADYCAGTVPRRYYDGSSPRYTVIDPDNPPRPTNLPATHAVVKSTQEIAITSGTGTAKVTLTIADGAITACVLS